jgi:predicted TPR repeat methyltransferase
LSNGSFNYFGDLSNILPKLNNTLNSGGILSFVLKKSEIDKGFRLNPADDYFSHAESYVKNELSSAGFKELQVKEFESIDGETRVAFVYSV